MKKYLFIAILILSGLLYFTFNRLQREINNSNAYKNNMTALMSDTIRRYQLNDSISAATVRALELTKNEFKNLYYNENKLVNGLQAKLNQIESSVVTEIIVRDSLIPYPVYYSDSLSRFEYRDQFAEISAEVWKFYDSDSLALNYSVDVPLTQVFWKEPKFRFLGINFGLKSFRQEVFSENPNVQIQASEYVRIRRKGRRAE